MKLMATREPTRAKPTPPAGPAEPLLPSNPEAEINVLGSLLIDPQVIADVVPLLDPADFYIERHCLIYSAIRDLHLAGTPADLVTLTDELARRGDLETIGGVSTVSALANGVPTSAHALHYARIIKRVAIARRRIRDYADLTALAYQDPDPDVLFDYDQGRLEDARRDASALLDRNEQDSHFTLAELMATDFPEPRWVVPGILPEGLTLLAGKPKMGKSWLALAMALAIRAGGYALGSVPVEEGPVLYLALEDTKRRIKKRALQLLGDGPLPGNFEGHITWPRLDAGGVARLETWLILHPGARLVVVDTLAKVRPAADPNGSVYTDDYRALEGLKRLADQYQVAILVIHHLRKMAAGDPLDEISGSTGLTGSVDNVLVMRRERGRAEAMLHVTGRDIDEQELALTFDAARGQWNLAGDAETYRRTHMQQAALDVLGHANEPLTIAEVAEAMSGRYDQVKNLLWRLEREGAIAKAERGRYARVEREATSPATNTCADASTANNHATSPTLPTFTPDGSTQPDVGWSSPLFRLPSDDAAPGLGNGHATTPGWGEVGEVAKVGANREVGHNGHAPPKRDPFEDHQRRVEALCEWAEGRSWPEVRTSFGVIAGNRIAWRTYVLGSPGAVIEALYKELLHGGEAHS